MSSIARSLKLKMTPLCYEPLILDKQWIGVIVFHKHHFLLYRMLEMELSKYPSIFFTEYTRHVSCLFEKIFISLFAAAYK